MLNKYIKLGSDMVIWSPLVILPAVYYWLPLGIALLVIQIGISHVLRACDGKPMTESKTKARVPTWLPLGDTGFATRAQPFSGKEVNDILVADVVSRWEEARKFNLDDGMFPPSLRIALDNLLEAVE